MEKVGWAHCTFFLIKKRTCVTVAAASPLWCLVRVRARMRAVGVRVGVGGDRKGQGDVFLKASKWRFETQVLDLKMASSKTPELRKRNEILPQKNKNITNPKTEQEGGERAPIRAGDDVYIRTSSFGWR